VIYKTKQIFTFIVSRYFYLMQWTNLMSFL
jgi:hypothetical protein